MVRKRSVSVAQKVSGNDKCGKVFKSRLSKFCGRQPLKQFKGYGLLKQRLSSAKFT